MSVNDVFLFCFFSLKDLVVYRDFDKPVFAAANATDQREPAGSVENATVIQQG